MRTKDDALFRAQVLRYYRRQGRHALPWRHTTDPYAILVSEIMLQQTQVPRVIEKFREFLAAFPTFRTLARAPVSRVLRVWQGLGYNRRALMLQRCAQVVVREHAGLLPDTHAALCALPGIGPYTAGALMAFAFDKPWPVIETNIRRVYLHNFFSDAVGVADGDILPLVERHVASVRSPRQWYSALMDYGTYLAVTIENPNRRSRHYIRQSKFEGSTRQLRGRILRLLLEHRTLPVARLTRMTGDGRTADVVRSLVDDGMVCRRGSVVECQ